MCLTGCLPWQKAALDDPRYNRYISWHSSAIPLKRQPKLFKLISSKAQRLFKKYLDPKREKRPAGLAEVHRFMDDRWLSKVGIEKNNETQAEEEGLCPSMYSFHSSPEEKNKLLHTLTQYGLETTVDRSAKKDRIREWIQASVIEEEDEEEDVNSDEELRYRDRNAGPIGERGPVTERKLKTHLKRKERGHSRRSPDTYRPPIDPRLPFEEQKNKSMLNLHEAHLSHEQNGTHKHKERRTHKENGATNRINERVESANGLALSGLATSTSSQLNAFNNVQHKISVQIPQSEKIINVRVKSPDGFRRPSNGEDKRFGVYNIFTKGSSSSNSNSTGQ